MNVSEVARHALRQCAEHEIAPLLERHFGGAEADHATHQHRRFTPDGNGTTPHSRANIAEYANTLIDTTTADEIIPRDGRKYLERWFLAARAGSHWRAYLHRILIDDDDAPHDHPWDSAGWVLDGNMIEQIWTRAGTREPTKPQETLRLRAGDLVLRPAAHIHRLILPDDKASVITLFVTREKTRSWGFWPNGRFVHWRDYKGSRP